MFTTQFSFRKLVYQLRTNATESLSDLSQQTQLPAPYKQLIDGLKLRENDWKTDNLTNNKGRDTTHFDSEDECRTSCRNVRHCQHVQHS